MSKENMEIFPPRISRYTADSTAVSPRRRVAAYARVSTDSEEQATSYEAQVDYFTRFIQAHADWIFVKVYTDEGISGVSTKHRDGFNAMVADAIAGKIDLIVTKSVSRFARNTVDSLTTIRKLKEHGVECFFEKENIWTFDGKGELLITIMSSIAQEESRSISENVTWGHRKRMADGKVTVGFKSFLGYDRGEDGSLVINPEEAKIVRLIFRMFMDGMAPIGICRYLEEKGVPTPMKKGRTWHPTTIRSILTNEKYKGDALLQKTFTVDFLTKKHQVNHGELQQYYIHGNHEAIIPPEEFDAVQLEIRRRKEISHSYSGNGPFASRIVCGDCGGLYIPKTWHSTDKYRRVVWRCGQKYDHGRHCKTPAISEERMKQLFLQAYNLLMADREKVAADCRVLVRSLADTEEIDKQLAVAQAEANDAARLYETAIRDQAAHGEDRAAFDRRVATYEERCMQANDEVLRLQAERRERLTRSKEVGRFIREMLRQPLILEEWDSQLWCLLVDKAVVSPAGTVRFVFKGGKEITVNA